MSIILNTKTYGFSGIANAISTFVNRDGGIAAAFSTITASLRFDTKVRGQWKLEVPIVAEEASSCACPGDVVKVSDLNLSFRLDKGLTTAERTDFALRVKDLVASPEFQASIINLALPAA